MPSPLRRLVKDVLVPVAVAIVLAFVIQAAIAKPYKIPTGSMVPTIQANDRIVANRLIYRIRGIHRGDVIVFEPTRVARERCGDDSGSDVPFVKRVVGLPGDRVEVRMGLTYVNDEPFVLEQARAPDYAKTWPVVPRGELLVLGDNRPSSCDSHMWPDPFVPEGRVIGEAEIIYWPLGHFRFL
ncbi:MAG: signal peptidase [Miltoncostaeaceae bacterium]|jgi:signal peptidase I|nr:signal peptidase [Miltoncostaeaceae bacterium]